MDARHWKKIAILVAVPASVAAAAYLVFKSGPEKKRIKFEEEDPIESHHVNPESVATVEASAVEDASAVTITEDAVDPPTATMIKPQEETASESIKIRHKSHKSSTSSNSWSDLVEDEESFAAEQDLENIPETSDTGLDECQLSSKLSSLELNDHNQVEPAAERIQDSGVASPASPGDNQMPPDESQMPPAAEKPRKKRPSLDADPGLGGSLCGDEDIQKQMIFKYLFYINEKHCGKLIGAQGSHVKYLKSESKCKVTLREDFQDGKKLPDQTCTIEGPREGIECCLALIRERFPLDTYPDLTLKQVKLDPAPEPTPTTLPPGFDQDIIVSCIVTAGQIFVQQPTQQSFQYLPRLQTCLRKCYSEERCPALARPILPQTVCIAPAEDGSWYRVLVIGYDSVNDTCDVKFLDFGGYTTVNAADLRQIREDYVTLPFQAIECYLANIVPIDGLAWSPEAGALLEELITDKLLFGRVIGVSDDMTPLLHLYARDATDATPIFVNRELVDRGVASWIEYSPYPL